MLYMVTWIPSIYPSHVSIYTSTMDPMGNDKESLLPILEYHPLSIESIAINHNQQA